MHPREAEKVSATGAGRLRICLRECVNTVSVWARVQTGFENSLWKHKNIHIWLYSWKYSTSFASVYFLRRKLEKSFESENTSLATKKSIVCWIDFWRFYSEKFSVLLYVFTNGPKVKSSISSCFTTVTIAWELRWSWNFSCETCR